MGRQVLVVSQARFGVKSVLEAVVPRLTSDFDVDVTYLSVPTNAAPEGSTREALLDEGWIRRTESFGPAFTVYHVLEFWRRAFKALEGQNRSYDAIWLHNPRLLPFAPTAVPLHITFHNRLFREKARHTTGMKRLYATVVGSIEARGLGRLEAARYSGVSPAIADDITRLGIDPDRCHAISNGVDTDRFRPSGDAETHREAWGLDPDAVTFLSLGRLAPVKRPTLLVSTFERLRAILDEPCQLVIAGTGSRASRLERETAGNDAIHLLGYVPEKRKVSLYQAADAFLLASALDPGGPLTLYEAAACGLACFTSPLPTTQFITREVAGALVDFTDPGTAADRIARDLPDGLSPMGAAARAYAERELDWDPIVEQYYDFLTTDPRPS